MTQINTDLRQRAKERKGGGKMAAKSFFFLSPIPNIIFAWNAIRAKRP